jgi:hypothetical protein
MQGFISCCILYNAGRRPQEQELAASKCTNSRLAVKKKIVAVLQWWKI